MADLRVPFSRQEGELELLQDDSGTIRVAGPRPRGLEQLLIGRDPLEAVHLVQQISADGSISHALTATLALESAARVSIPHNGVLLRDLLHMLSFLHAHLRNFYFQALPDYIPQSTLADYEGGQAELRLIAQGIGAKNENSWARAKINHPFRASQLARVAENQVRALKAIARLQRFMAAIGGKFPIVMCIVPGGMTTRVNEGLIIKLRGMLRELDWLMDEAPMEDGLMIVGQLPELQALGGGGRDMICAGTLGDDSGPDASMYPRGVLLNHSLVTFQANVTETVHNAFYRIPLAARKRIQSVENAPDKAGAYSWIKSPRYTSRPVETGALARLIITHQAGSRSHTAPVVKILSSLYGPALDEPNTVAGRMLARLGELQPLLRRCESLLDQLTPGQPSLTSVRGRLAEGEAAAGIESPAGMVQHHVVLEKGRIVHYDIIGASTWSGAPQDEDGAARGLELALNAQALDLRTPQGQLRASRILHSYFFSATDAVQ